MNDIARVIARLEQQRTSIDRALSALREIEAQNPPSAPAPKTAVALEPKPAKRRKNRLSPEGRRRIAEAAKKYWAAKRAAEAKKAR